MGRYAYEALDKSGNNKNGEIEAASQEEAIAKIRAQGMFPTGVRAKSKKSSKRQDTAASTRSPRKKAMTFGGVRRKELTTFTRQFSTLVDAGLPFVRSLRILEEQLKPGVLKNAVMDIADDVEGGSALWEAMSKHPNVFDKLYVNMVKAGEAGGVLDQIFQRLADFMEKSQKLKRAIIGALIYPVFVLLFAGGILVVIMVFIVPKFQKMFSEMDLELPGITILLTSISTYLFNNWLLLLIVPALAFLAIWIAGKTTKGRYAIDMTKLYIPVFGQIVRKSSVSRFCRTLGTLIVSGVPILEALTIIKDATGNVVVGNAVVDVHGSIKEGDTIAEPLRHNPVFDNMCVNMIAVGEETGELDKMLIKIADNYDNEVDNLVAAMMSLLEPFMIIGLGVAVGFIVIALFLPLVSLIQQIG